MAKVDPRRQVEFFESRVRGVETVLRDYGIHGEVPTVSGISPILRPDRPPERMRSMSKPVPQAAVELSRSLVTFAADAVSEMIHAKARAYEILPAGMAWESESNAEVVLANDASSGCPTAQCRVLIAVTVRQARLQRQRAANQKAAPSGGLQISDLLRTSGDD